MYNYIMQPLLHLWTGPLPHQELHPDREYNPLVHWVFHPLKRHLARLYLRLLQNVFGLRVIAITGSVGKTTTKELLASILKWSGPTVSTVGNITPTYNIPAAILSCSFSTRFLILEMGVEYPGDMDFYLWLAQPDIGIITTVNLTHTAFLGTLSDVAGEKGKLLSVLQPEGYAVVNSDDPNIRINTRAQIKTFGSHASDYCQIISSEITSDFKTGILLKVGNNTLKINLPLLGTHFAADVAAAVTVAAILDTKPQMIVHGLQTVSPPPHRLQIISVPGAVLLDDTYNANPVAVKAALDVLAHLCQTTHLTPVFVMGQMNELGQYEQSAHEEIGEYVKKLGIKDLFTTGEATKYTISSAGYGTYFATTPELLNYLVSLKMNNSKLLILLKASHSLHFEDLVESLTQT